MWHCFLRLCTGQTTRLGRKGAEEIKQHPFFQSIDWTKLRKARAPFIPELASATDTAFFEDFEYEGDDIATALSADKQPLLRRQSTVGSSDQAFGTPLSFLGYWYVHSDESDRPSSRKTASASSDTKALVDGHQHQHHSAGAGVGAGV
eukprot:Opistho-2@62115